MLSHTPFNLAKLGAGLRENFGLGYVFNVGYNEYAFVYGMSCFRFC